MQEHTNPYSPPFTMYISVLCTKNSAIHPQRNCLPNLTVQNLPPVPCSLLNTYILENKKSWHPASHVIPGIFPDLLNVSFPFLHSHILYYYSCVLQLCSQIELSPIFNFPLLEEGTVCIQLSTLCFEIFFPIAGMIQLIMKQLLRLHSLNQKF